MARALSRMSFLSRGLMVKGSRMRMVIFSGRGSSIGQEVGARGLALFSHVQDAQRAGLQLCLSLSWVGPLGLSGLQLGSCWPPPGRA